MFTENGIIVNGQEIALETIINKVMELRAENKVKLSIIGEYGRSFEVEESIVLSEEDAHYLCDLLLDKEAYFGEIAGKHSDVCFDIEEKHFYFERNKDRIHGFLNNNPTGRYFNYSFIDKIAENYKDDFSEKEILFLDKIRK